MLVTMTEVCVSVANCSKLKLGSFAKLNHIFILNHNYMGGLWYSGRVLDWSSTGPVVDP